MAGQFSAQARTSSPIVVPVRALGFGVDDRPVGDVREQEIDIVVEFLGILDRSYRDEALFVALGPHIPALNWVASAERHEGPAVQHSAAKIEILIDHQHSGPEIPRANGRS